MALGQKNRIEPVATYSLQLDQQITRRKFYHVILEPSGDFAFKAKHVGDCLEWFNANGIERFEVLSDNSCWLVTCKRTSNRED